MDGKWTTFHCERLIEDGILEIGDGYRAKNSEMGSIGLPFARVGNINNGFNLEKADILSEKSVRIAGSKISHPGDIVFTSKGTVGRFAFVKSETPQFVYSPQLCYWRVKRKSVIDPRFLFYWMQGPNFYEQVYQVKSLTTMADYVSLSDQRKMTITVPYLPVQHKIANILSAYDDLIENNTRRIAILEEMARILYQEWFVKFRFPGYEPVGTMPEDWKEKNIGDIVEALGGGTPSTQNSAYWDDGDILWYSPTDLTSAGTLFVLDSAKKITSLGLRSSSARLFPAYSVMMTSRATIGVIAINTQPASTNQGFITCIPNDTLSAYQIYHWLLNNQEKIIGLASGATFKEINKATFRQLTVIVPDKGISQQFNSMVLPIYKQIENLIKRNANLRRTRDLLLPKLISGEIDVSSWVTDEEKEQEKIVASEVGGGREMEPAQPIDVAAMQQRMLWE